MRNLTFLASDDIYNQATCFRRAFMEKTAVWSVRIQSCHSSHQAAELLQGKDHAFVSGPRFRNLLYETGGIKGASARLSQGADVMYRTASNTMSIAQLARSVFDCIEETFIPVYGARVAVLGSGSAALDLAYEASRAGVASVALLDEDRSRAEHNLAAFLDAFDRNKASILDTEQSRLGHLSATRAYEQTSFSYGSFNARGAIEKADIILSILSVDMSVPSYVSSLNASQIVCDPWGRAQGLLAEAEQCGCDVVSWRTIMTYWGSACADLLIQFGNAGLK